MARRGSTEKSAAEHSEEEHSFLYRTTLKAARLLAILLVVFVGAKLGDLASEMLAAININLDEDFFKVVGVTLAFISNAKKYIEQASLKASLLIAASIALVGITHRVLEPKLSYLWGPTQN